MDYFNDGYPCPLSKNQSLLRDAVLISPWLLKIPKKMPSILEPNIKRFRSLQNRQRCNIIGRMNEDVYKRQLIEGPFQDRGLSGDLLFLSKQEEQYHQACGKGPVSYTHLVQISSKKR